MKSYKKKSSLTNQTRTRFNGLKGYLVLNSFIPRPKFDQLVFSSILQRILFPRNLTRKLTSSVYQTSQNNRTITEKKSETRVTVFVSNSCQTFLFSF